jgi:hypothetical protein
MNAYRHVHKTLVVIINKCHARSLQIGEYCLNSNRVSVLNDGSPVLERKVYQVADIGAETKKIVSQIQARYNCVVKALQLVGKYLWIAILR